ncbi:MAG: aminotransferase class IV [Cohaesibacter sp.]|nr:aminotransferase class IV [Cohaesibacter sp.]
MSGALAISLNGSLISPISDDKAMLSAFDRGTLLGDGLFETLPIWNNQIIWLQEHLARLKHGLSVLGMTIAKDQLIQAVESLLPIARQHGGNAILRLTVTRGQGGRGLLPPDDPTPTIMASLSAYPLSMAFADVTLATSTIARNEGSPLSRLKSLGYLDNILATKEAKEKGAEDALFYNNQNKACCTTIANLFALQGETILTPPLQDGILGGIMRQTLLDLLPKYGFEIKEQSLDGKDIKKVDGLFLTNSLRIIRRVTSLDGHVFDNADNDIIAQCQTIMKDHLARDFTMQF